MSDPILKKSEWEPYAPAEPGVVRVNHASTGCSGSSASMKVERHDDGSVSAKCYRCGGWGRTKEKYGSAMKAAIKRTKSMAYSLPFTVEWPDDVTFNLDEFNTKARAKIGRAHV